MPLILLPCPGHAFHPAYTHTHTHTHAKSSDLVARTHTHTQSREQMVLWLGRAF